MNKIIIEQVAKHRKEAETLVRAFYDHPEISMEETASSRAIVDALAPPMALPLNTPLWKKSSAMIRPFAPH